MKSKAAIGNHPIHPTLVPIPIGAFSLAILGDIMRTVSRSWVARAGAASG
jgi:uncharacterized membrane protein